MLFLIVFLLSFFSGIMSQTLGGILAGILVGIYLGTILEVCWIDAKKKTKNSKEMMKMKKEIEEQDRYDNEWGIINYDDK